MEFNEQKYINICFNGDYYQIITYLNSIDDAKALELLKKYKDIYEKSTYVIKVEDERVIEFLHHYEDYLKWALINQVTTEECKTHFLNKFQTYFPQVCTWGEMQNAVVTYFKDKGYYITFGVTKPYPDMYLWSKQTTQMKSIELPEGEIEISVCEMDGIVTRGWLDYFSLNKVSAGGWVTTEGTNYFKDSYDINSDNFQISLLKHEAQHFFDLKNNPGMQSSDLEYRAKLVELIYYKDMKCFLSFLDVMSDRDNNPHAYANKQIVQALSNKIFGQRLEMDRDLWINESIKISSFSLEMLKEHSEKLLDWDGKSCII